MKIQFISILMAIITVLTCNAKTVNPLQYGLLDASNDIERFEALMRCHKDAVENGYIISYAGIREIDIEIPFKAQSVPLPEYTDFANVRISVYNHDRNYVLFLMTQQTNDISITGRDIDLGSFRNTPVLEHGLNLVIIEDQNPWIAERLGYNSSGFKRKDIIVVKNGNAQNKPIQPYDNENSNPKAWYCPVSRCKKVVKNLNFYRTEKSTVKTYPIAINYQYNVELSSISMTTPENTGIVDDCGIMVYDCAKIVLNDIRINGTYSQTNHSGSGVRLINVYDVNINRMYARCEWGVFGNYFVNKAVMKDCDINRFDIHCYGRDVKSIGCKYSGLYNQFSSIYGDIIFKKCVFDDFVPVLIESSYNAYTPFNLTWSKCTFYLTKKRNYLLTLFRVPEPYNSRPELRRKSLPNITLTNCKVVLGEDIKDWYIVWTGGNKYKDTFDYITEVSIKGLKIENEANSVFSVFSEELPMTESVDISIKN